MTLVQKEVKRITMRPNWSEVQIRPEMPNYLCFTAVQANSTVNLWKTGSPTSVTLETSTNGNTWTPYTIWTTITLTHIGDKLYMRNTSETTTGFSTDTANFYIFTLGWSLAASGDVTSLINKNCTDTLNWDFCFYRLFYTITPLTMPPAVPATTLSVNCYRQMFYGCSNMVWIPKLPAVTMKQNCYLQMFYGCSKIKLSSTQTWSYTQAYRIPTTWTWTIATNWNNNMITSTWWTFTSVPSINTTYYVHTDNTIVW